MTQTPNEQLLEKVTTLLELAKMDVKEINARILKAENKAKAEIKRVEGLTKSNELLNMSIDESSTMANYVKAEIGLYLKPDYKRELKAYTAQIENRWTSLYYGIRDNVYGYYKLIGADIKKDYIVMNIGEGNEYLSPFWGGKEITEPFYIKKFKNGSAHIIKDAVIVQIIEKTKEIEALFYPKPLQAQTATESLK